MRTAMKRIPTLSALLLATVAMFALAGCAKDNANSAQTGGGKEVSYNFV